MLFRSTSLVRKVLGPRADLGLGNTVLVIGCETELPARSEEPARTRITPPPRSRKLRLYDARPVPVLAVCINMGGAPAGSPRITEAVSNRGGHLSAAGTPAMPHVIPPHPRARRFLSNL